MRRELSAVRKLIGSADREAVVAGLQRAIELGIPELTEALVDGLSVEPDGHQDSFGRRNLCVVNATSKAEVVKRVKPPHRGLAALSLLKVAGRLDACEGFTLNPFSYSKNLQKGVAALQDAALLDGLPRLESLELHRLPMRGLTRLPSLRAVKTMHALTGSDNLASFKRLEVLQAKGFTGEDLRSLSLPASLTRFVLSTDPGGGAPSLTSLAGLERCKNLQKLQLGACRAIASLSGVEALESLTSLLIDAPGVTSLDPLSHLTRLETLYLTCRSATSVDALRHLTALKTLSIGSSSAFEDLRPFATLQQLKVLKVPKTPTLVSLNGAQHLPALQVFSAYECAALSDVKPLLEGRPAYDTSVGGSGMRVDLTRCASLPERLRFGFRADQFNALRRRAEEA